MKINRGENNEKIICKGCSTYACRGSMEYEASTDMNWERFADADINQRMDAYLERVKSDEQNIN